MPKFKVYGTRSGEPMKGLVEAESAEHAESIANSKGMTVDRVKVLQEESGAGSATTAVARRPEPAPVAQRSEPAPVAVATPEPVPVAAPQPAAAAVVQPPVVVNIANNNTAIANGGGRYGNPVVAALLSLIIPGLGQFYGGRMLLGVVWFWAVLIGYIAFIIPGLILHFICVVTAATGTRR